MGFPSMSRRRRAIWLGVAEAARIWLVPEIGSSNAYSGRAPYAEKATHWLVPLRQAVMLTVWPSASGAMVRASVAMPAELVIAPIEPCGVMPPPGGVCHATDWPARGLPLERTRACTVQRSEEHRV